MNLEVGLDRLLPHPNLLIINDHLLVPFDAVILISAAEAEYNEISREKQLTNPLWILDTLIVRFKSCNYRNVGVYSNNLTRIVTRGYLSELRAKFST